MKKLISIVLIFSMLIGLNVTTFASEGTESNPYVIETPDDLQNMRDDLSGHYVLGNDIDMTGYWYDPVGNEVDGAFTGSLDGKDYTISNLDLDLEGSKYVGLFGYLDGNVKNLNLEITKATGYRYVGGVAGYADENGEISGCTVDGGEVEGKYVTGDIYCGGIVGFNKAKITKCNNIIPIYTNGNVSYRQYTGGISGYNFGIVSECTNNQDITSTGIRTYLGGIIGYNNGVVNTCINNGGLLCDVYLYSGGVPSVSAGGIAGYNNIQVYKSYNSGNIRAILKVGYIQHTCIYSGGIVGYNNATTSDCYNTGRIFAQSSAAQSNYGDTAYSGGISGYNSNLLKKCINVGTATYSSYSRAGSSGALQALVAK